MIESNKLMAKFLGWKYHITQDISKLPKWVNETGKKVCTNHEQLKFDTDWNWLMQVVEKIEKECEISIQGNTCRLRELGLDAKSNFLMFNNTKIQAVYSACLQFIQNESNI